MPAECRCVEDQRAYHQLEQQKHREEHCRVQRAATDSSSTAPRCQDGHEGTASRKVDLIGRAVSANTIYHRANPAHACSRCSSQRAASTKTTRRTLGKQGKPTRICIAHCVISALNLRGVSTARAKSRGLQTAHAHKQPICIKITYFNLSWRPPLNCKNSLISAALSNQDFLSRASAASASSHVKVVLEDTRAHLA